MQETIEALKNEINAGGILERAEKAKTAKKTTIKDSYEIAYEPIKAPAGAAAGGNGSQGCCTIYWLTGWQLSIFET